MYVCPVFQRNVQMMMDTYALFKDILVNLYQQRKFKSIALMTKYFPAFVGKKTVLCLDRKRRSCYLPASVQPRHLIQLGHLSIIYIKLQYRVPNQLLVILFGNNSWRRVITITDLIGLVEITLWGDDMINKINQEGVSVVVKCVTMEYFKLSISSLLAHIS